MRAYVGFSTSLQYWLTHGTDVPCYQRRVHLTALSNACSAPKELRDIDFDECSLIASTPRGWNSRASRKTRPKRPVPDGPAIHVLVPAGVSRTRLEGFDRHCWTSHIPDGSFCMLRNDIYLSTPEFSYLQMAGVLTIQQLVYVGYQLCACYRTREDGITLPADPVTSVAELRAYLDKAEGCYGAKKARQALRWIADRARSSMETKTAMLASLPPRLGGYGLPVPLLNYVIKAEDLDPATLDRSDREFFELDLYWPERRVGVEYDGSDHYDRDQVRKDKRRINCLTANGMTILCVMYDQLADAEVRETLMYQLAKLLGKPLGKPSESDLEARDALNGLLFGNEFAL